MRAADINVTPLVGVLFVLLCVMMLYGPNVDAGMGVGLRLPDAVHTTNRPDTDGELTVVSIAADRALYVNGRQVLDDQLAARVTASLERNTDQSVLIKADEEVPYLTIMAVMDRLRTAQITNLSLVVQSGVSVLRPGP